MQVIKLTLPAPDHIKNNPVYSKIWFSVRTQDKSYLGIVTGKPRTGKSTSGGGRFLYDLDRKDNGKPRFTVDKVIYDPKEFIQELKKKRPKGSAILWDEVGIGAPRREWYTLRNRLVSQLMQTMGYKNRIIVLTVPSMKMVDSNVAPLLDFWIQMKRNTFFEDNIARAKFYWTEWHEKQDRLFTYWPRAYKNGIITIYKNFNFRKPPDEWVQAYKEKQEKAKDALLERADDMIIYMHKLLGKSVRSNLTDQELYEIVKSDLDEYIDAEGKKVLTAKMMIKHKGLDYRIAARVAKAINDDIKAGKIVV